MNEQQDMPEQEAGSESILQKIVQLLDENRTDDLQSVIESLSEEEKNLQLTASFKDMSIDEVLRIINQTLDINLKTEETK